MNFFKCCVLLMTCWTYGQTQFVGFVEESSNIQIVESSKIITLTFTIESGYHIQDVLKVSDYVIPTEVRWEGGIQKFIKSTEFRIPKYDFVTLDTSTHRVISGTFYIIAELSENSTGPIGGVLYYQACDNLRCFYPRELSFSVNDKK